MSSRTHMVGVERAQSPTLTTIVTEAQVLHIRLENHMRGSYHLLYLFMCSFVCLLACLFRSSQVNKAAGRTEMRPLFPYTMIQPPLPD